MNATTGLIFVSCFLLTTLLDWKAFRITDYTRRIRWMFWVSNIVAAIFLLSVVLGFKPAMPSDYFIHVLSPWVKSVVLNWTGVV